MNEYLRGYNACNRKWRENINDKIEELEDKIQELSDEQGYWGENELLVKREILQDLLEEER